MSSRTACPELARLKEHLNGTLPGDEEAILIAHLDTCLSCQHTLEALAAGGDVLLETARKVGQEPPEPTPALGELVQELQNKPGVEPTHGEDPQADQLSLDFLDASDSPGHIGRIGHYEVIEVIGRGGMGVVLKAFDAKLHRVVAIKVMAPQLATSASARKRFTREAQAAAAVRNEHVISIYAVEDDGQLPYLVMEYIDGVSLQASIERTGPLELKQILRIGAQTAAGLAAAHAQGLIHRDIKPANILLENAVERVKITDFGLARAADDVSVTQSGVVAGTPQYMAPEQAKGDPVDHRADLFSLGSVLYAMCTGRPPFRASGTMAVLKRVCEDTPRPIREINPEIPEWLGEIIARLHGKNPADRFQSAAEVAQLLSEHLAHLQQPSLVPMPGGPSPLPLSPQAGRGDPVSRVAPEERGDSPTPLAPRAGRADSTSALAARAGIADSTSPLAPRAGRGAGGEGSFRRRRLMVAAAVLTLVIAGLGLTEATGVTQIASTVIRILTPDGTLVVELDDPEIKVSIDGEELSITGAGAREVRLRPGQYKFLATKDGQPLRRELVTITRGDRQVVKVTLEGTQPPLTAQPERQAFVVLTSVGAKHRKYDTLAEAVQAASDGDTIEIRGNGPFVTEPITTNSAVTIRAGDGFKPVIQLDPNVAQVDVTLLATAAPLVLEGLELQHTIRRETGPDINVVSSLGEPLYATNCRFLMMTGGYCCRGEDSAAMDFRNCEFIAKDSAVGWVTLPQSGRLNVNNCVAVGINNVWVDDGPVPLKDVSVRLARNTFVSTWNSIIVLIHQAPDLPDDGELRQLQPIRVEASSNVLYANSTLLRVHRALKEFHAAEPVPPDQAEGWLARVLGWREDHNGYQVGNEFLELFDTEGAAEGAPRGAKRVGIKSRSEWEQFWRQVEARAQEGRLRFRGGDILSRWNLALDRLSAEDFRLRPNSLGYHAGPDGKDLGADIDLVGPGAAYERWKKTPEYQQWLKDTRQLRAEAPKPESKAFVVLNTKGDELRKLDTLAEAVQRASDSDTIEVRGNGPFVTPPIRIGVALTIRAASGFKPLIRLDPKTTERDVTLLNATAPLVLEGLELHHHGHEAGPYVNVVASAAAPIYAANCRFVMSSDGFGCRGNESPVMDLRNCEFFAANTAIGWWTLPVKGRLNVANCVATGTCLCLQGGAPALEQLSIRLMRNSFVSRANLIVVGLDPRYKEPDGKNGPDTQPVQMETSENILETANTLFSVWRPLLGFRPEKALSAAEAEALIGRLVGWRENDNHYSAIGQFLVLANADFESGETHGRSLEWNERLQWDRFWSQQATGARDGRVKFRGGNILTRSARANQLRAWS